MIRIGAGSGFWGDWQEGAKRLVTDGPIDYLVMDYLAELTLSIMALQKAKDPELGYARDFVSLIDELLPELVQKNITVIANAGGVNPAACAKKIREVADRKKLGNSVKVALVTGDDLLPELDTLIKTNSFEHLETGEAFSNVQADIQSANAYIGCGPILEALREGANIIVTGRVADPSLFVAPIIYESNIALDDYDRLCLASVAAHCVECGAQVSGGNYLANWRSVPDLANIGYPVIELGDDEAITITKHEGSGGLVSLASVKEQMVYEIGDPKAYLTPDVQADFCSISLKDAGKDRVRIQGGKGKAPTDFYKVSMSYRAGYRVEGNLLYSWPDAYDKAIAAGEVLKERLSQKYSIPDEDFLIETIGANACHGSAASFDQQSLSEVMLRVALRTKEREAAETLSRDIAPLVLNGPPCATGYASGRPKVRQAFAYWPTLLRREDIKPGVEYC